MVALSIVNVLIAIGIALFGFTLQTSVAGVNRKIVGRMQKRYGPKWYQEFRDIFKALSKRGITHGWVYDFGVMMALGGILATSMFMPVAGIQAFKGYDDFFIFVYLFAVGMLGMAMSASGSGNPLASIGVMRALTQMVGYEVPFMVVIIALISAYDTSLISELVEVQQSGGWNLFRLPLGAVVGFVSLMGMLGKKPFDTFIAPSEIASGPMVEYGGKQLGMLFILHEVSTFIEVTLFVNLFLGGGENIFTFLVKYFIVYTTANLIANTLGRFKIDQVIKFYYRVPILLALVQAGLIIFLGWGVN